MTELEGKVKKSSLHLAVLFHSMRQFRRAVLPAAMAGLIGGAAATLAPSLLATPVAVGQATPNFTLQDLQKHPHSLAELRGRPVAIFFFCGCDACTRCASLWADAQRSGALTTENSSKPVTVAVFMGEAAAARTFVTETGLDLPQTLVLTDPQEKVASAYGVTACPRFFILDAHGRLCRTNNERGEDPQTTPAALIVSRAQTALLRLEQPSRQKVLPHASTPHAPKS